MSGTGPHSSLRKRITITTILLAITGMFARAQDMNLVPGLWADHAMATSEKERSTILSNIGFNLILSEPDSAQRVSKQALAIALWINDPKAIGDAYNSLGWLDAQRGKLVRAEQQLDSALVIFNQIKDTTGIGAVLINLGWVAEKRGDLPEAVRLFQDALRNTEALGDSMRVSVMLYSIGTTYRKMNEPRTAREYIERSLGIERTLGREGKEANCLMGIANTYEAEKDLVVAEEYYVQAIDLYERSGDRRGLGIAEENLGLMYVEDEPLKALIHFKRALALYDTLSSTHDKAYLLVAFGKAAMALKRYQEAMIHFEEGQTIANTIGDLDLILMYESERAELAGEMGDGKAALAHSKRYQALKDSLQGADTQRELARLRTEFETERKELDNVLLRAKNMEQQQRLRSRDIQLYGSITIGLLALITALLFWRNARQERKHAQLLDGLNQRLEKSNGEISEINALLEMKVLRSQMNPHFIYNCLNSATQMTQAGQNSEALAYLQGFARLLRMVLDHSVTDHVPIQEELDFLRQYLKLEAHRTDGLRYTVEADSRLIDEDVEIPALLVQPFVENALWHGLMSKEGDRELNVNFSLANGVTVCTITDNGIGRKGAAAQQHNGPKHRSLGVQLTSERLRLLSRRMGGQGSYVVEDLEDVAGNSAGTRVTLRLSLDAHGYG